jgi:hypothetical protein
MPEQVRFVELGILFSLGRGAVKKTRQTPDLPPSDIYIYNTQATDKTIGLSGF